MHPTWLCTKFWKSLEETSFPHLRTYGEDPLPSVWTPFPQRQLTLRTQCTQNDEGTQHSKNWKCWSQKVEDGTFASSFTGWINSLGDRVKRPCLANSPVIKTSFTSFRHSFRFSPLRRRQKLDKNQIPGAYGNWRQFQWQKYDVLTECTLLCIPSSTQ